MNVENIPFGHENAVQRPSDSLEDRKLRREIEKANTSGDCIINVGNGYYRPILGDPNDEKELDEYLAKELSRSRAILYKRMKMREAFNERRYLGIFTDNTRKVE